MLKSSGILSIALLFVKALMGCDFGLGKDWGQLRPFS